MAQVRDYMDYLEDRYGFAPVNSQEEVFAAQTIAEALEEHKLSTTTEEFSAPAWGKRLYGIPMIGLFIAAILFFFTGVPRIVGVILLLVCAAPLVLYRLQITDLLGNLGPKAQSQNVVAVRPASGVPEGEKPGRPVVILAHYDTAREELLASPSLSPWRGRITSFATYTVPALVLLALISLIPAIPVTARYVLVALALVASIPTLIWGISDITGLVGPLTAGSVDNKSSVAALLSIADKVCYGVAWHPDRRRRVQPRRPEESKEDALAALAADQAAAAGKSEPEPEAEPEPVEDETVFEVPDAPEAVRHGSELIRELGILPESCELVYVEPAPEPEPEPEPAAAEPEATEPEEQPEELFFDGDDEDYLEYDEEPSAAPQPAEPEPQLVDDDESMWGEPDFDIDVVAPTRRSALFDIPDPSRSAIDPLGSRRAAEPAAVGGVNAVFDSAYPGAAYDDDQFETPASADFGPNEFSVIGADAGMGQVVAEGTRKEYKRGAGVLSKLFGRRDEAAEIPRGEDRVHGGTMTDWLGVDEEFDVSDDTSWDLLDDDSWKGGAARSDKLRFVPLVDEAHEPEPAEPEIDEPEFSFIDEPAEPEIAVVKDPSSTVNDIFAEEEAIAEAEATRTLDDDPFAVSESEFDGLEVEPELSAEEEPAGDPQDSEPVDYELREAITAMAIPELQSHDIWFVAVGASELDHAGAAEFIEVHRRELRGAFVINLSCVGAGDLTVITDEGIVPHRRSDRRLVRHLLASADDLHIPVSRASITWGDTDAMAVMRRSMRAATVMGCSTPGVPALSHTRNDLPGTPDKRLIADVVELVAETIRRS